LGEVVGINTVTTAFDEECPASTDNIIATGTHDMAMQLLHEEPSAELLGPFPSMEANTRTVKTRSAVYIPFELVFILLGQDLPACRA
jgi:hypothetical protein